MADLQNETTLPVQHELVTDDTVYILDSYGLIYRAYFALISHPLTNTKGQNISALVIFFRNLKALLTKYRPQYLAAAFDSRTPTFRHELYKEYKATRQKTPDDLHAQVPWIEEILTALGVPVLRVDGFEADDIIATVATKCAAEKRNCRILSGDKDLMQLVTSSCEVMKPDKANGGWLVDGIDGVKEEWGILPEKMLDLLSLTGDTADNIPGVKGVGDKTALKLLDQYGTLDGIYEHADEIKGALGEKIRGDKENAYFSRKLITLRTDVPVELDFATFKADCLHYTAAGKLLASYGAGAVAKSFMECGGYDVGTETAGDNSHGTASSSEITNAQTNSADTVTDDGNAADSAPLALKKNVGNYKPVTKLIELTSFIDSVLSSGDKTVAFDTETDSLETHKANLVGFSLCCETGAAIYVPVILPGGMFAPETIAKQDALAELSRLFSNKAVTVIMHNGKFDIEVLNTNGMGEWCGINGEQCSTNSKTTNDAAAQTAVSSFSPVCKIVDTMVAAWLLNPDALGKSPYSLEYLGETKLGLSGIEFTDVVEKGQTFADVPLEKAYPYGAEDSDFTWQLWQLFKPALEKAKLTSLFYNMEMEVLPILARMEETGIHLDKQVLADYSVELAKNIVDKEQDIYKEVGHEFNIASTKQLQQVLFDERKLMPGKKTKTGYSTDTAVLEDLASWDPVPRMILDYRSLTKLQSTYVEALPLLTDDKSRIHTTFLQTGTATGRLSSRDPNLQNIPVRDEAGRKIRAAFTAIPGTVLISADYAQIELVVLAHLSSDENMCKAFRDGVDVHKSTASLLYNVPPEKVTPEMRRTAKTINFGIMYGMSAFRLSNELGISRTEAKNFIDAYFTTYAGINKFRDETIENAKKNGYVETIMGRRRKIVAINSRNKLEQQGAERIALNTPIQGSAADIVKQAMIDVQTALDETKSPAHMLLQVHDELIFECPNNEKTIADTIALVQDKMEHAVKLQIPLRVSVEHGENWGVFH
jgi:DNA polymerase-1